MKKNKLKIIAEAGVNHNGNIRNAFKLADIAKKCGADFVKFQFFISENLASKRSKKAEYQVNNFKTKDNSQLKMLKKLELKLSDLIKIEKYCKKIGINFLLSFFDHKSVKYINKFDMDYVKIPSGEITNFPLLRNIAKTKKKIILSTGMANLNEIDSALKVFKKYKILKKNITILHCTTDYPTKPKDVNLNAMLTIRDKFNCDVGYSDHTVDYNASLYACILGATIIEKHFTINKKMKGPDHKASLSPNELKIFITKLRQIKTILGSKIKKPQKSEMRIMRHVRKSVYATKDIKKNEKFSEKNIMPKRPYNKISPMKWPKIIKKNSKKMFRKDDEIEL